VALIDESQKSDKDNQRTEDAQVFEGSHHLVALVSHGSEYDEILFLKFYLRTEYLWRRGAVANMYFLLTKMKNLFMG
jgi:hypothetical protein